EINIELEYATRTKKQNSSNSLKTNTLIYSIHLQ
ncbi:hypothetical protein Trydic_g12623, partial [Trypoxylus dichotomus]